MTFLAIFSTVLATTVLAAMLFGYIIGGYPTKKG